MFIKHLENSIINLRPYSWMDLLFVGFLAKVAATENYAIGTSDIILSMGLLSFWFFFNLALEHRHNYEYRPKAQVTHSLFFLLISTIIGFKENPSTFVPVLVSSVLVAAYLLKNHKQSLGLLSALIRGSIQAAYFFYAVLFYSSKLEPIHYILGAAILVVYAARAIIGDLRDLRHNAQAKKQTLPVVLGEKTAKNAASLLLFLSAAMVVHFTRNWMVPIPIVIYAVTLFGYSNYYVMHQLMIATTTFFSLNLIVFITGESLLLTNLTYLGIHLNAIFYPLLQRKSNPIFK